MYTAVGILQTQRTHSIKNGFVFSQGDHAKPVAQVLQQGSIREISSCLVRGQEDLNKAQQHLLSSFILKPIQITKWWPSDYLNVPVGFIQNHFNKLWILQRVEEVGVKAMKVWLDADTLHHEVLRHPGHKLFLHSLLQLFNLHADTPQFAFKKHKEENMKKNQ